jgi:biotin carboxyl carrier protein
MRTVRQRQQREGAVVAEEIRAEMVANVWKVVAAAGDTVAAGDTIVILESMKMEIPVLAEDSGILAELAVSEGDVVQEGDLIARLS